MKKIIALLTALIMLCALCVPAFANELTETANTGSSLVKTDTSTVPEGGTYSVTYDAEISVPWNQTTAVESSYTVETHLEAGKTLNITATSDGEMTYDTLTLAYTLGGDTAYTATAAESTTNTITVTVAQEAWDLAPVAEYTDTITYTAQIV